MSDSSSGITTIVVEQKGSDAKECIQRINAGRKLLRFFLKKKQPIKLLVVGGANKGLKASEIKKLFTKDEIKFLLINRKASNTREKSESVAKHISDNNTFHLILVSSSYHLLRAYLTLVKTFNDYGLHYVKISIFSSDFNLEGLKRIFMYGVSELVRLPKYAKKGHLTIQLRYFYSFFRHLRFSPLKL